MHATWNQQAVYKANNKWIYLAELNEPVGKQKLILIGRFEIIIEKIDENFTVQVCCHPIPIFPYSSVSQSYFPPKRGPRDQKAKVKIFNGMNKIDIDIAIIFVLVWQSHSSVSWNC